MTPNEQKVSTAKGMVPVTDALLDQMVQAIVAEVDPEKVILFGSRARGDAREDSDVDLVVVEAEPFGKTRSRRLEAVRLWFTKRWPVLIASDRTSLIYSRDEVESLVRLSQPCPWPVHYEKGTGAL